METLVQELVDGVEALRANLHKTGVRTAGVAERARQALRHAAEVGDRPPELSEADRVRHANDCGLYVHEECSCWVTNARKPVGR